MQHETVIVLDFGGQYNQLIARRVRENNVYCEIYSYKTDLSVIKAKNPKGIIFTGGPNSVYLEDSPTIDPEIFSWGVPVLGICYGSQLMMHLLGGHVCRAPEREYGKTEVFVDNSSKMFEDVQPSTICWMSHNDYIEQAAPGFKITAHTVNCPVAAAENAEKGLYAVQFHPEVLHTAEGKKMLRNFVYNVCGCSGDWKMDSFVENNVKALRERIGDGKVLCALSGGVDSSVLAAMLAKAIGKQLTCVFVDHGLLRKNEKEEVCSVFGPGNANGFDINFICVDARDRYFSKLAGVTEPERKRKIIGEKFIRTFEKAQRQVLEEAGARGKEVKFQYTTLEESNVDVTLQVYKMATLPVKVNFINAPRGFDNSVLSYALSCKQLKVAGPAEKIDALSTLSIGTIDLSTFSLNKVYEMPIELPTDIYLLDNISTITVSFDCSGLETKTMNLPASCVQVVNLPATYQLTVETERLMNVILCGPKGAMETLTPEQVVIEIDAEDFAVATGQQNIACRLYVPSNGKIFALGSYVLQCRIESN